MDTFLFFESKKADAGIASRAFVPCNGGFHLLGMLHTVSQLCLLRVIPSIGSTD